MTETVFFRLLKTPIDAKGDALAARIAALNATDQAEETFSLDTSDFRLIPGSPFAYWARALLAAIADLPCLDPTFGHVIRGPEVFDLRQSARLWLEVPPQLIGPDKRWVYYAKGGKLKPYAPDVHLVTDYASARDALVPFRRPGDCNDYFKPGLTFTQRTTSRITMRVLNAGCLTSPKGPGIIPSHNRWLWYLMAVGNSSVFQQLMQLKVGAADAAARSYDLTIVRDAPVPRPAEATAQEIESRVSEALRLVQDSDRRDEVSTSFCLPELVRHRTGTLQDAGHLLDEERQSARSRLSTLQAEIDNLVFDLYGLSEDDRALVRSEMGQPAAEDPEPLIAEADDEEEEAASAEDLPARVQDLLMWCVGVAFGRWDVRMALDPSLLPALQAPFDPLPRCAPGALVGTHGLPPARAEDIAPEDWLRARKNVLDLPTADSGRWTSDNQGVAPSSVVYGPSSVAWDGILVDDPAHPADIVARFRAVLELLWGERADAVEREVCAILGVKTLRDYFRDPRGFFAFHIKRYSKSRRKAPIYWLLQSEKRGCGIWLYCHRLAPMTLYSAARDYADPKVSLEQARLKELRDSLQGRRGGALRPREAEIERQDRLVAEVAAFRKRLDAIALLNLPPDLNDGVVISIAPLHELVPWKEAQRTWDALVAGEYPWSTMARQMRERGLVR
jgi:hypothetical protein